jgi:hypothetical protein
MCLNVDVEPSLESFYRLDVDSITAVSEVHAASIFMLEVSTVVEY